MTTRFALEVALHWAGVAAYVVALVLLALTVVLGRNLRSWGTGALVAGLVPHGLAIVSRWIEVGHGPYMLKHEVLSSNAWIALAVLVLFLWRRPAWSAVALVVIPAAVLMIAVGMFAAPAARDLPPTLRSIWLVFHITFAKISAAAFLLSVATSVLVLLKARGAAGAWIARTPPADALDAYTIRFVGFGLLFWTVTIAAGSIWANLSWGRYWGWDAMETWSLVTWLVYGTLLHARLFFRLRMVPTAWGAIGSFVMLLLTLLILPFLIPSLHSAYFQ